MVTRSSALIAILLLSGLAMLSFEPTCARSSEQVTGAQKKQTIITIFVNGSEGAKMEFPPSTKTSVLADHFDPDPENDETLRVKGHVKISVSLESGQSVQIEAEEALLTKRVVTSEIHPNEDGMRRELEALLDSDQSIRGEIVPSRHNQESEDVNRLLEEQAKVDQKDYQSLEKILEKHGWPKRSVVGDNASLAAFLVLQHSTTAHQKKWFPELKKLVAVGEIKPEFPALLEDRILVAEGKPQTYGTQVTFTPEGEVRPKPISDSNRVNERRKSVGLPPLEEYLESFKQRNQGNE